MSQADELLSTLAEKGIHPQLADPETEPHIVVDDNRIIHVPKELQRIAVQYDHDVETVTFDCPRYWDGLDMSQLSIYINYRRKDRVVGCYKATNIAVDEVDSNTMHFNWTITRNVSEVVGPLVFLVCVKKADANGNEENHWNSELNTEMYISEGLETGETVVNGYPDIISQWEEEVQAVKDILLAARDSGELDGATFTPSVDDEGNLSWTNDRGRPNPGTVNIHGYSPAILVRDIDGGHQLIITDVHQSQTVGVLDGYSPRILVQEIESGHRLIITDKVESKTVDVLDGTDGYSPRVLVRDVEGGHELVITDKAESKTVQIPDGSDGYSPTVSISPITNGNRVTITDATGPHSFDVLHGATPGNGVSPTVNVSNITGGHRVSITDIDGTKTFDVLDGTDGEDGYSPRVLVRDIEGGHELVITDKVESKTVQILNGVNGADGEDGYSPTIAVSNIEGGHKVTITNKTGTISFDVLDGADGNDGVVPEFIQIGDTEPASGPILWFDTSYTSAG